MISSDLLVPPKIGSRLCLLDEAVVELRAALLLSTLSSLHGSVTRQHRRQSPFLPAAFIKLSSVSGCSSAPAADSQERPGWGSLVNMNIIKSDSPKTKPLEFEGEKGQVWILNFPPARPTLNTCTHSPPLTHMACTHTHTQLST